MEWCGRAHHGDKVVRQQFGYKIECFDETQASNSYCRFIVGQTYMGRCKRTSQNMSIIITKKTPQYVFYETDTGLTGRAILKYMNGNEDILIKKADDLIVSSADKWS